MESTELQGQLELMRKKNKERRARLNELWELINKTERDIDLGFAISGNKDIAEMQRGILNEAKNEANQLEQELDLVDFCIEMLADGDPLTEFLIASILPDMMTGKEAVAL